MRKTIKIDVPREAESKIYKPYLEGSEFKDYCVANKVEITNNGLEELEKSGLLLPCVKIIYPEEYVQRREATVINNEEYFEIEPEWEIFLKYRDYIIDSHVPLPKNMDQILMRGHPIDAILGKDEKYVFKPLSNNYKPWNEFDVWSRYHGEAIKVGTCLENYYSSWKIFIIDELSELNTVSSNLATQIKRGWRLFENDPIPSSIILLEHFFSTVQAYSYRESIINSSLGLFSLDDPDIRYKIKRCCARMMFCGQEIESWVYFVRKLVVLFYDYTKREKYILREELRRALLKTLNFLMRGSDLDFEGLCMLYDEKINTRSSIVLLDGQKVFPGALERIFPSEKVDIHNFYKYRFARIASKTLQLDTQDELAKKLEQEFREEFSDDPEKTVLAPLIKLNRVFNEDILWSNLELWDAFRGILTAIEYNGKRWFGGDKLNTIFTNINKNYVVFSENNKGFLM